MKTRILVALSVTLLCGAGLVLPALAADTNPIQLPPPALDQSKSLVQALTDRKSSREFSEGNLSPQVLSNLLWAAFGISRPDSGKRTAPSAYNRQETDVYVATAEGTYLYDAKANTLIPVASGDLRALTGTQSYFKDAAVNLVYVADLSRMNEADEATKMFLAGEGTGFIAQNAYLYCAVQGLATVFRVSIDKAKLGEAIKLRPDQKIMGAQTVGLPKSPK
jgi:nitroreductase